MICFTMDFSKFWKSLTAFTSLLNVGSLRCRTPRTRFAGNEVGVSGQYTDSHNRGMHFQMQTPTSLLTRKARGVPHHPVSTWHSVFCSFYDSLKFESIGGN
jgi:hypothetical protein